MSLVSGMRATRSLIGTVSLMALESSSVLAAESKAGLPQLDTSFYPGQIFWLVISFIVLYAIMAKIALPSARHIHVVRRKTIAERLNAAHASNEAAKRASHEADQSVRTARAKAHAALAEIRSSAQAEAAQNRAAQEKELSRRIHTAESEIVVAKEHALESIRQSAPELAKTIVDRVTGLKVRVE